MAIISISETLKDLRAILLAIPPSQVTTGSRRLWRLVAAIPICRFDLHNPAPNLAATQVPLRGIRGRGGTKRYDGNLRLEDLAGKVALAGYSMGRDTDLWILGGNLVSAHHAL